VAIVLVVALPASGASIEFPWHHDHDGHGGHGGPPPPPPAPVSNLTVSIPTDLVYSVPVSLPLSPTYSEGLQNYAALAVFRHKSVIVVSIDQGSSWRRCDASSEGDTVVSLLRSSLAALHADIWVTTTHSDDSSTVTLTS
jgi:hypothetical protein